LITLIVVTLYFSIINSFAQDSAFTIATFNLRLDTPRDSINQWNNRKQWVSETIQFYDFGIVGMQEVLHHQLIYLLDENKTYKHIGVGRDDGKQAGEYSPIMYDASRFELLQSDTFWLSETPQNPGLGWDAKYNRVVTWGKFKDVKTGKIFFVFNTHFDHIAETARRESAKLLHKRIVLIAGAYPVVVTGDFNATLDSEPMQMMLSSANERVLKNTFDISNSPHFGPLGTFNGFAHKELSDKAIDHILVTDEIGVLRHATLSNTWDGRFASDHFAVMATILLK
ncbi:endonuclease/exonuclease/phosphatase family protein, partial [bacterium]